MGDNRLFLRYKEDSDALTFKLNVCYDDAGPK